MVRVIYLLSLGPAERDRLIEDTLSGVRWEISTARGRKKMVTDKEMVDVAQNLEGWTLSVYRFGCAFIHLSDFHNHLARDPFMALPNEEREDVLAHMRHYHGGPASDFPSLDEILCYIPRVFEKIASNLECYLKNLERAEPDDGHQQI